MIPRSHPEQYYLLNETQMKQILMIFFSKIPLSKNTNNIFKDILPDFASR